MLSRPCRADFMFMAPPFIAYFAADTNNASLLETAYRQCGLYREVILFGSDNATFAPVGTSPTNGSWHHIVGPQSADPGLWSTGNGWAAMGMARVLATVLKAPVARGTAWRKDAIRDLTAWIKEIVDGARGQPADGGLLRNYLNDISGDGHGFGEISGSAMLAAVAYRMVVHAPGVFDAETYVTWADSIRTVLGGSDALGSPHVTSEGIVTPAVNPLGWSDTAPWTAGRCVVSSS
jgi:rhamnogalacturonyl hydrolase YesR